jgi:hypothetical protein
LALLLVAGRTAPAAQADITAREPVIGLSFRGAHRAYPLSLFSDRRVVNDVLGSMEVAVFHDPERGLATAWFRTVFGEPIEFSGAADGAVAADLTTVTRWDLETGVAVWGNLEGQRLVALPATTTTWAGWEAQHPDSLIYSGERP